MPAGAGTTRLPPATASAEGAQLNWPPFPCRRSPPRAPAATSTAYGRLPLPQACSVPSPAPGQAPAPQGVRHQARSALRRVVPAAWEGAPLNWRPSAHAVAGRGPGPPPVTTICGRCRRVGTAAPLRTHLLPLRACLGTQFGERDSVGTENAYGSGRCLRNAGQRRAGQHHGTLASKWHTSVRCGTR
jgi:hypothetical protein